MRRPAAADVARMMNDTISRADCESGPEGCRPIERQVNRSTAPTSNRAYLKGFPPLERERTPSSLQRHGLDPFVYLRDVLGCLPGLPKELLPDRWSPLPAADATAAPAESPPAQD